MTDFRQETVASEDLLFDPNNLRFHDVDDYVQAADDRLHETTVQTRAYQRLRRQDGLVDLKNSILKNGYVPVERLVVRPYDGGGAARWVVVEGNRRLAAIRWIQDDHEAGAPVEETVLASVRQLPVIVVEEAGPDEVFRAVLMGIRHVSSIKQWGGYQRAKLIASMRDGLGLEAGEVAERLGLRTQEVNRRYRAYKALEQMQQDEEYGDYCSASQMYPLFHEAIAVPVVREWLGWDDGAAAFTRRENLVQFYELLTPSREEDGETRPAKISTYFQVRELRGILTKPEARRLLLDPVRSFQDAVNVAKQEELSRAWATDVTAAIGALNAIGIRELKRLSGEDVELLVRLGELVAERLADHSSLVGGASGDSDGERE